MSSNSDRFLDAFSKIEHHLRRATNSDKMVPFSQLIDKAGKIDPAVRNFCIDLQEYGDLRNAIVHERTNGHVIAEPNNVAVKKIEQMVEMITKPPTLRKFMTQNVTGFKSNQSMSATVQFLYRNSFSQAPVYDDGKFLGLLSPNAIARWLGANVAEDIFSLKETSNSEVLKYTENPEHVLFLQPDISVFEALEHYQQRQAKGIQLEAILITNSGKRTEKILGLITVSDLPKLYDAIRIR